MLDVGCWMLDVGCEVDWAVIYSSAQCAIVKML